MKPQSYSQEDISKAVIELVGRSQEDSTPIQKRGITKLKSYGSWNLCEPENMNGLRNFFSIFDDVFFNGVLTGYCSVSFPAPARTGWYAGVNAYCRIFYPVWEQDPRFKIETPRIEICIMPGEVSFTKCYALSSESILATVKVAMRRIAYSRETMMSGGLQHRIRSSKLIEA
jgi:hypothetical protein